MLNAIEDAFEENQLPKSTYNLATDIYVSTLPKEVIRKYITEAEEIAKKHPNLNNILYLDRIETFKQSL